MMLNKMETKKCWHTVVDGSNCPTDDRPVVALWNTGTETYSAVAYRDEETRKWYLLEDDGKGDAVLDPDYWIELPG